MLLRTLPPILVALALVNCGGVPGVPGVPGGASKDVNPNSCGSYANTDVGAKLKSFLQATVQLQEIVAESEVEMGASCKGMAQKLELDDSGSTSEVCNRVSDGIKEMLSVGLSANASLTIDYKPAVCEVNIDVAASAAAKCEASASGEVSVTCEGTCSGTCKGACDGTCEGSAGSGGSGGECNGTCEGTCGGECSGGCEGNADVQASAECEAHAEVSANAEAKCTKPEVKIEFAADVVLDKPKVDMVVAALKEGMPQILMLSAKIKGPVTAAFTTWSASAKALSKSSGDLFADLGREAATCVGGQLAAAAGMVAGIQSSLDVQVEVSVSVSASASAEGGGSAGS